MSRLKVWASQTASLFFRVHPRHLLPIILGLSLVLIWDNITLGVPFTSITIFDSVLGSSTQFIGACEGSIDFDPADLKDLGINTYRIYGGMSRWEAEDDDGMYGSPTIEEIKANPNVIPWTRWDQIMSHPATGTDYAFSGPATSLWQGSAKTIFQALEQAKIRPVVTLRNSDPGWYPGWALQLNPPRTEADWNEWWEHVFATAYWLNVRNDFHVDDFEIHNEPDNRQQGWGGNQKDYFKLAEVTQDAIAYLYATYLPDRTYHLHAPKTTGHSQWPKTVLGSASEAFDIVNIHIYDLDISGYVTQVRHWMQGTIHERSPLWVGEWGSYTGGYDDLDFALNLLKNLMHMSRPGESHVDGSHIFSLYDWGPSDNGFEGLIDGNGDRRLSYYALRMGIRALQGGRPILSTLTSSSEVQVIATKDNHGHTSILIVNSKRQPSSTTVDISARLSSGTIKQWEVSQLRHDEMVSTKSFDQGHFQLTVPAQSAVLIQASPR